MKTPQRLLIAVAALAAGYSAHAQTVAPRPNTLAPMPESTLPEGVEIQFASDGADLVGRIAELIDLAEREVLVSAYAVTDTRVLQALSAAVQRGVLVAVLLDRNPGIRNYDTPRYLRVQNVAVIAASRGLSGEGWHNQRYVVIDREAVAVSSCDLINSARRNSENLMVVRMPAIAARYHNNWFVEASKGERLP